VVPVGDRSALTTASHEPLLRVYAPTKTLEDAMVHHRIRKASYDLQPVRGIPRLSKSWLTLGLGIGFVNG
jgi:hypothetical protein